MLFPKAPKVQRTMNYSKFKLLSFNRNLSESNVAKLIAENEIAFNMDKFPIIITSKNEILDGQHRYEACKRVGWPVYYVVENQKSTTCDAIFGLNRAGKKHTVRDRVEMRAKDNHKLSKELVNLRQESIDGGIPGGISYDVLVRMANKGTGNTWAKMLVSDFKNFDFIMCRRVMNAAINSGFDLHLAKRRIFMLPLVRICNNYDITPEYAMKEFYKKRNKFKYSSINEKETNTIMWDILKLDDYE